MVEQIELDWVMMNCARSIARMSKAERGQVGCIIEKRGNILAYGFNGTPTGFDNCCEIKDEHERLITKPEVLHAEANALMKIARSTLACYGATVYTTLSPCFDCAKMLIQAHVNRVVYLEEYRDGNPGKKLMREANIEVEWIGQDYDDKELNGLVEIQRSLKRAQTTIGSLQTHIRENSK